MGNKSKTEEIELRLTDIESGVETGFAHLCDAKAIYQHLCDLLEAGSTRRILGWRAIAI